MPPQAVAFKKQTPLGAAAPLPAVHFGRFEGPLDLLLHLVREGRMDVFDLPIARLCDQYMAHLDAMTTLDLRVAGEFLVMAATLLEIKSRLLLPAPPKEDTSEDDADGGASATLDPRAELVARLLEYGKYQSMAETLLAQEGERRRLFFRDPTEPGPQFALPPRFGEMSAEALLRALQRMLAEVGAGERAVTSVRRQKITLRLKMKEVLTRSEAAGNSGVTLDDLLPAAPFALLEVVLLFLALLELLKVGSILVAQEQFCGEMRVFFVPEVGRARLTDENVVEGLAA
jgi:segregation and condensation protein A